MRRLGLIVNPLAGIGGRVGLKGSDGVEIQQRALELGAQPVAAERALETLGILAREVDEVEIFTAPGEMGADIARRAGLEAQVVGQINPGGTTAADTLQAARLMVDMGVDLILFVGGDGTARDIYQAVGEQFPVVGIPAGVKIHSPVFATHPRSAGYLAAALLKDSGVNLKQAEVIDLDETAFRRGILSTRLYGYLTIPFHQRWVQGSKTPSPDSENVQMEAIAWDVVENLQPGSLVILGPGTTTRAVADRLGLEKTLVGVDMITKERLVLADASEQQLLEALGDSPAQIVVTPIGGQGFLFGRGNQPISPRVIKSVGLENLVVICTPDKLHTFAGQPLLVDTGDPHLDEQLAGYITITTGYRERAVYRVGN